MNLNHINGVIARNRGLLKNSFEDVPINIVIQTATGREFKPSSLELRGSTLVICENIEIEEPEAA